MTFQTKVIDILEKLIAFDTTSYKSNLELMRYVQVYLSSFNMDSNLFYNQEKNKANLFAILAGQPSQSGGILFSGHTDTVPTEGQNWSKPPYQLMYSDQKYFGRGTADMKSFIALLLAFVPKFVQRRFEFPLYIALSYDEEIGCVGVRPMLNILKKQNIQPSLCIIGEPTNLELVTAHKGKESFKVEVWGKDCHSGLVSKGVNAIVYAAKLISFLDEIIKDRQMNGPFDKSFNTPHSTLNIGTITGGTSLNIVPRYCTFNFEFRNIQQDDFKNSLEQIQHFAKKLSAEMRKVDNNCRIEIKQSNSYPALQAADSAEALRLIRRLTVKSAPKNIDFGTEGGLFNQLLGTNSIILGPGSMSQGHKQDEFISSEQLMKGENFFNDFIEEFSIH